MNDPGKDFEALLAEADAAPFSGWDFSFLDGRVRVEPLPWDYRAEVAKLAARSPDLLDMGTGGGEWLSKLYPRPESTAATEAWSPNVPIARARLRPLGIHVVQVEPAPDNCDQSPNERRGPLPFRDESFHLVINRHEAFVAIEVARILLPGGYFVTQQVGTGNSDDFRDLFGAEREVVPLDPFGLKMAVHQLERAGLEVIEAAEGEQVHWYGDVAAAATGLAGLRRGCAG